MSHPMISARVYFSTYVVLMISLILTVVAAYIHLGLFNPVVAMSIAVAVAVPT